VDLAVQRLARADRLTRSGVLRSASVREAFLAVDRSLFVRAADRHRSYHDVALELRTDELGVTLSTISQPAMVVIMLEQLAVGGGDHVLEIGTGSGYNAALLARLVSPGGDVVSIEVDAELAREANHRLVGCGISGVRVVVGDGRVGEPAAAPYDRIIATVGVPAVPAAWIEQLRDGGRLVVPIVDDAGSGASVAFDRTGDTLVRLDASPCRFLTAR
jgi:protein-L-isoaspartate(D-aspartate) O-methyltransferase